MLRAPLFRTARFSRQFARAWTQGWLALLFGLMVAGCGEKSPAPAPGGAPAGKSFAIYAEFARDANVPMKSGLNRRVFNTVEAQAGSDIQLDKDGAISLQPGTYRLTGFSAVTMQTSFAPPTPKNNLNYPGYALVYYKDFEANDPLKHQIGIGSAGAAIDGSPSLFDLVVTCDQPTKICVGHQSGEELHDEVYLSIYDVAGATSPFHVFARVAVMKL